MKLAIAAALLAYPLLAGCQSHDSPRDDLQTQIDAMETEHVDFENEVRAVISRQGNEIRDLQDEIGGGGAIIPAAQPSPSPTPAVDPQSGCPAGITNRNGQQQLLADAFSARHDEGTFCHYLPLSAMVSP